MDDSEKFLESIFFDKGGMESQLLSLSSVINILIAAVFGFLILFVYLRTSSSDKKDSTLPLTIPVLTMLMATIMRMQGGRIAIFFGIFGVLSIVRFRSELTDQRGITFILFSIVIGVLVGLSNYVLVVIAFLIITIVIFIIKYTFRVPKKNLFIFKFEDVNNETKDHIEEFFNDHDLRYKLLSVSCKYEYDNKKSAQINQKRLEYELYDLSDEDVLNEYSTILKHLKDRKVELEVKKSSDKD